MSDQETPYDADIAKYEQYVSRFPLDNTYKRTVSVLKEQRIGYLRGVTETEARQWEKHARLSKWAAELEETETARADEHANGAALAAAVEDLKQFKTAKIKSGRQDLSWTLEWERLMKALAKHNASQGPDPEPPREGDSWLPPQRKTT